MEPIAASPARTRMTDSQDTPTKAPATANAFVVFGATGDLAGKMIVPALMLATGMPILSAVGSSLVAVTTFGATTAASYAWSGLIVWKLALLFVVGGIGGGMLGGRLAGALAVRRGALNATFAAVIIAVALYMLVRSVAAWA